MPINGMSKSGRHAISKNRRGRVNGGVPLLTRLLFWGGGRGDVAAVVGEEEGGGGEGDDHAEDA